MSPARADEAGPPVSDNPGPYEFLVPEQYWHHDVADTICYNPSLDTVLRAHFHTQSYGQEGGTVTLGSFKAFELVPQQDISFVDAQVNLNEEDGVGYNVGVGVRYLSETMFTPDPLRITGLSLWSDGTSTHHDAFFSQVGITYESLGDIWDFRMNGYAPVTNRLNNGPLQPDATGALTILPIERAYFVADYEIARRLGDRDAWAFAGPYYLSGDGDDATGYRVGLRGYAFPDVLLQVAVTDDDIFETNVAFAATWFIGRTRTDYTPTCTVIDRFREPVYRNDYVAVETIER